jgi:hypothetical protein
MIASCGALAPLYLCAHLDLALYLLPAAVLALVIAYLSRLHPLFFLFTLAGTICHELAHLLVGWLVGARPVSMSIIPRRVAGPGRRSHWQLGSVSFTRLRWYNAAPAALAPFFVLLLPLAVACWRTRGDWQFGSIDLLIAMLLAPQFLSFWPSGTDWRIAARSWPLLVLAAAAGAALFQLVKR